MIPSWNSIGLPLLLICLATAAAAKSPCPPASYRERSALAVGERTLDLRRFADLAEGRPNVRPGPEPGSVTFTSWPPLDGSPLWVTGDFDGWGGETALLQPTTDGRLQRTVSLPPGRYRFDFQSLAGSRGARLLAPDHEGSDGAFNLREDGTFGPPSDPGGFHTTRARILFSRANGDCDRVLAQREAQRAIELAPSSSAAFDVWISAHLGANRRLPRPVASLPSPELAAARGLYLTARMTRDRSQRHALFEEASRQGLGGARLYGHLAAAQSDAQELVGEVMAALTFDAHESRATDLIPELLEQDAERLAIENIVSQGSFPTVHRELARFYLDAGDYPRARTHATSHSEQSGLGGARAAAIVLRHLWAEGLKTHDFDTFERDLHTALGRWPESTPLHSLLREATPHLSGHPALLQTLEAAPSAAGPSRSLSQAMLFATTGLSQRATNGFERVLKTAPEWAEASYRAGINLQQQGEEDGAVEHFNRAMVLGLNGPHLHLRLARLHVRAGRPEMAAQAYQATLEANPRRDHLPAEARTQRLEILSALARLYETDLANPKAGITYRREVLNILVDRPGETWTQDRAMQLLRAAGALAKSARLAGDRAALDHAYRAVDEIQHFENVLATLVLGLLGGLFLAIGILALVCRRSPVLGPFSSALTCLAGFVLLQALVLGGASHVLYGSISTVVLEPEGARTCLLSLVAYAVSAPALVFLGWRLLGPPRLGSAPCGADVRGGVLFGLLLQAAISLGEPFLAQLPKIGWLFSPTGNIPLGMTAVRANSGGFVGLVLALGLLAPLVEELFFRATLHSRVAEHLSPVTAAILSGGLFALVHLRSLAALWLIGIALGLAFHRRDSVWLPLVMHLTLNLSAIALMVLG